MKSSKIKEILEKMEHGIELMDGRVREYDILDYFKDSELSVDTFNELAMESASPEELRALLNFYKKNYGKSSNYPIKKLKEDELNPTFRTILSGEINEQGLYIEGTGIEITTEQKVEAFDLLDSFNRRYTVYNYRAVLRRIANGYSLYDEDTLSLK